MTMMSIRDVSLNVEVVGHGCPLLLKHGARPALWWPQPGAHPRYPATSKVNIIPPSRCSAI